MSTVDKFVLVCLGGICGLSIAQLLLALYALANR